MDEDDKTGVLGCSVALLAIAASIGGVVWFINRDVGPEPEVEAAQSTRSSTPLTRVSPVREKTVVSKALPLDPMARKIVVGDPAPDPQPVAAPPVTLSVQDLGQVTEQGPPPAAAEVAATALAAEQLCYKGRIARRAPSLFDPTGLAITYGANDFNSGDPLPRLEFFFDPPSAPTVATFLSMTDKDMPGFPANHELPVVYDEGAIHTVIARWIAAIATETCPAVASPTGAPLGASAQ